MRTNAKSAKFLPTTAATQFNDENLLHDVSDILVETGMDPATLELEITESMLMHNVEKAMRTLNALKQIGIRLEIDDFGTGLFVPVPI